MRIIISPWSHKNPKDPKKENPKNYPYWHQLVSLLKKQKYHIIQIGVDGEEKIKDVDEYKFNLSFPELEELTHSCDLFIGVDNFYQHFCNSIEPKKKGIVLWGRSDPKIFGYNYNENLLKSTKNLRKLQFDIWWNEKYVADIFVAPQLVLSTIQRSFDV